MTTQHTLVGGLGRNGMSWCVQYDRPKAERIADRRRDFARVTPRKGKRYPIRKRRAYVD